MAFYPYLNFGGNCREAFERYHEIFGGELVVLTGKDVPADAGVPAEQGDLVLHAALKIDDALLMASDAPPGEFGPVQYMYVNWSTGDAGEAERVWKELSDGATVEVPLGPTFFSPAFGVCVDRFGTPWMINTWPPEEASA